MPRTTIDFDTVRKIGLMLPGVEESTAYGQPALKIRGKLLACLPAHRSAEPGSLAVRVDFADRAELLAEAPDVYYLTDHYVDYNAVLVRLARVNPGCATGSSRHGPQVRDSQGGASCGGSGGPPREESTAETLRTRSEEETSAQICRPKRFCISRRPALVSVSARQSRSWITHFRFSATFNKAAPIAPPRCGRRSLQSTQANAKRRRKVRIASISIPRASNTFTPFAVSS